MGLPIDLVAGFSPRSDPAEVICRAGEVVRAAPTSHRLRRDLEKLAFQPAASCDGFRAAADSGQEPIRAVRVQATSGAYWTGPGDGGCLDLLAQLADAIPQARIMASVERRHLNAFEARAAGWANARSRATIIAENLPVAQWAQDNGKSGRDRQGEPVLVVPRYASRGELGAVFVPGETFLADGLAAAGVRVVQSPLLFQGGNIIVVEEGQSGRCTILVGEAEIWRNTALGLSKDQAAEWFRVEFGADRCIVLPAASFHLDFEVTIRTMPTRVVAFVADAPAAARIILECGISAMASGGTMSVAEADRARGHLAGGRLRECLSRVAIALGGAAIGPGRFSEAFAAQFSAGPGDHGPSNLYRVLLALDLLSALHGGPGEYPTDPNVRAYLETFAHQEADRRLLHRRLKDAGYEIVLTPSLAEPFRGINAINGLHSPSSFLMPAYGGLFAPLDAAAGAVIRAALSSDVRVQEIACAETQRRSGALRCAISVFPTA